MITSTLRPVRPRIWRNFALAGAATLATGLATTPAQTDGTAVDSAAVMGATLWLAQAEGGDGGEAVQGGKVAEVTPYVEGYGFVLTAKALAAELAADPDAKVAAAGAKATEALTATSEVFGDLAPPI